MSLHADVSVERGPTGLRASIEVRNGEVLAIVGPNGAGKTTMLAALAGLVPLDAGEIVLDGDRIERLPPEQRHVGICFQDALLFPRLSILENVAFPLRARKGRRDDARTTAATLLAELAPSVDPRARPAAVSGGEQQRVALARALAAEPRLLLLDEPLAAVDVSARADLRRAIRGAIQRFEGPCIVVAHDPVDALTMADRVAILEAGRITQQGTPEEIRREPASTYAADLVGVNLFEGALERDEGAARLVTAAGSLIVAWPQEIAHRTHPDVIATLRPAEVSLHRERPEGSARNVIEGTVAEIAVHGDLARVRIESKPPITAEITSGSVGRLDLRTGDRVFASVKAVEIRLRVEEREPDTLGT